MTGQIRKLIPAKKCGFIRCEDGEDYFFHASALKNIHYDKLHEGQDVQEFEPVKNADRGPRAENVYV